MSMWKFVNTLAVEEATERKCVELDENGTLELSQHLRSRQWRLGGYLQSTNRK